MEIIGIYSECCHYDTAQDCCDLGMRTGQYVCWCLEASEKFEVVCYGANRQREDLDLPVYSDQDIAKKLGVDFEEVWIAVSYYDLGGTIRQLRKAGIIAVTIVRPKSWTECTIFGHTYFYPIDINIIGEFSEKIRVTKKVF